MSTPSEKYESDSSEKERDVAALSLDDPVADQIDRSVVVGSWLKQVAMWALRALIIAVAAYALWFLLSTFWVGLLPIILALIVCTVLAPPTTWMRRRGMPSVLAALISILLFFGALGAIVAVVAPDIARQSQVLYLQALEGIQRLQLWAQGPPLNLNGEDLDNVLNDLVSWVQDQAGAIAGGVVTGLSTATSLVITLFMVVVLVIFFLKDGHLFLPWVRSVMGRRGGWHATELLTRSWTTLGGYIRAQAIVSAVDALAIGLGLWAIGVPMAFTLAVITFVAGFVPYVGAITAGALAVLVALVSLGFTEALLVLILIVAVQQLEGNILSPLLQSRAMNLHPVIVLISVVVGGGLFGLVGAFLAVPAAAMIAVAFRYLLDITSLQAGEKKAAEIEFITPEGLAMGRVNEEHGRVLRQRWREDGEFFATAAREYGQYDDVDVAEDVGPPPAKTAPSPRAEGARRPAAKLLRRGGDAVERLLDSRRNRRN